jgi:hypothetical protein
VTRRVMLAPVLMLLARPAMTQGFRSLELLLWEKTRNRNLRDAPLAQIIQNVLPVSQFL